MTTRHSVTVSALWRLHRHARSGPGANRRPSRFGVDGVDGAKNVSMATFTVNTCVDSRFARHLFHLNHAAMLPPILPPWLTRPQE